MRDLFVSLLFLYPLAAESKTCIPRRRVVQAFNPTRNASSDTTPFQVGNGNFAFGVDVTGLQTFKPFGTLSTWGWHNFSLPTTPGQTSPEDFRGQDIWTHGRLVNYNNPTKAQDDISQWLIKNPQRLNLGRIGFSFCEADVAEADLEQKSQVLDMWSGKIVSTFVYKGNKVVVETRVDPDSDVVGVQVESKLLFSGDLGIFFDFPYSDINKFDAPYVGVWNATSNHTTTLRASGNQATIQHVLDDSSYFMTAQWEGDGAVSAPRDGSHRYTLKVSGSNRLKFTAAFYEKDEIKSPKTGELAHATDKWWRDYWRRGGFVDLTGTKTGNATELQRRILLSQYLMAVNSASTNPPQESGLVNNGWYGKFHLEMYLWHSLQFARWNQFPLLWRSSPNMYQRFLDSSVIRAKNQGYKGARWGKMTDPTGRSAPGEINSLLIWQQPHPMYFAEIDYRSFPNATTLANWDAVLTATADFMASYGFFNESTGVYDLGPPLYPVSENGNYNTTVNPTFELAYWRFGLDVAKRWKERQGQPVPREWIAVRDRLAPLPVQNGTYVVWEGIRDMWVDRDTVYDHPAMAAIYGLLPPPPPSSGPPLDMDALRATAARIKETWALDRSYGWDFAMLAMNALRLGDARQCVEYLLHPAFQFDDAGYPLGGTRVATPYFPNSASLLLTVAMMAGGWDGAEGMHFPEGWDVKVEGFIPGL